MQIFTATCMISRDRSERLLVDLSMPGDVTVHHGYCAHGSINNTTDRDRWSYLFSYSPADTRYWNAAGSANSGSQRLRAEDEEANPVIYRPAAVPVTAKAEASKL